MSHQPTWRFDTEVIHAGQTPQDWSGASLPPIFQTASHVHRTAKELSRSFAGEGGDIYMRLTNPSNTALENKLTVLERAKGAVATSSGMAAITNACMALLRAGDEFVAGNSLFMSTYVLFTTVFKKYGITARIVESTDLQAIEKAINSKTRFVYLETIGNPKMDIPDLAAMAEIAHHHGVPLLVDSTLATPYLCRPLELGADVVIHSTTKYLNGHGCAVGGIVIDGGNFPWADTEKRFADFKPFVERKGRLAYLDKVWREHHINYGTTLAPMHAFLTMVGLDTLAIRMQRHLANALEVARFLSDHPLVKWVNYPGLYGHPGRDMALRQFNGKGFGAMLTFGLKDQTTCFRFINALDLVYHLANLGDCKTLVIHPYSTQYASFDESTKESLSITPDMIRLSVGIEAAEDIIGDLDQALTSRG